MALAGRIKAGAAYVEITADNSKLLRGLKAAQSHLRTFGQTLKGVGADLMQISAALALPLGYAVKGFADFDDKIRALRAISGASSSEINSLQKFIRHLGATTAFTAHQVAQGGVELSRMGFTAQQLSHGLKPAMDLVRATGEETYRLGEMSSYAAASLRIYNLLADDFTDVCDVMGYAANRSAMNIADLGEAMKIAGPSAASVNENIRDTAAALMVLANAGVKGSLAGTSLRKIYQSLAAQSGKTEGLSQEDIEQGLRGSQQLADMGVQIIDPQTGNLRKAADIMIDLAAQVKKMKTGDKINFATDVFDLRGSLGALSMLNNPGELKKFRQELDNTKGYVAKTAAEMEKGIGGMFRFLLSQFQDMQLSVGDAFYNTFEPYIKKLPLVTKAINRFLKNNQKLIAMITLSVGASLALGVVLFGLGAALKVLAFALSGVSLAFSLFVKVLFLPISIIKGIATAIAMLKAAFLGLKVIIHAVIVKFFALAPALMVGATLGLVVKKIWETTGAWKILKNTISSSASEFKTAFDEIKTLAVDAFGAIKNALAHGDFAGAAKIALAALKSAFVTGIAPVKKTWNDFGYFLLDSWSLVYYRLVEVGYNIWKSFYVVFMQMKSAIMREFSAVSSEFSDIYHDIVHIEAKKILYFAYYNHVLSKDELNKRLALLEQAEDYRRNKDYYDLQAKIKKYSQPADTSIFDAAISGVKKDLENDLAQNAAKYQAKNKEIDTDVKNAKQEYANAKRESQETVKSILQERALPQKIKYFQEEIFNLPLVKQDRERKEQALASYSPAQLQDIYLYKQEGGELSLEEEILYSQIKEQVEIILPQDERHPLRKIEKMVSAGDTEGALKSLGKSRRLFDIRLQNLREDYKEELERAISDKNITTYEEMRLVSLATKIQRSDILYNTYKKIFDQISESTGSAVKEREDPVEGDSAIGAWTFKQLIGLSGKSAADRTAKAAEENVVLQKNNAAKIDKIIAELQNQGVVFND